jgi:hypothetical protein
MVISSQGEACSPNDDIKALDLNGTNALRDRLLEIQASTGSGEESLLAGAEIELENDKKAELAKIEEAKHALQDFRSYLAQSSDKAAQALPSEEELVYNYNPETQECKITRLDDREIVLDLNSSHLQGELPLPAQLMVTMLYCADNQITVLPELPDSLTLLNCRYNDLTTLPELPASLPELWCNHNQLTALPELPDSLTNLYCSSNQLTALPKLPDSLTELDCGTNQLTTLPVLPISLTKLDCSYNHLTTLPVLPTNLTYLCCESNHLTKLPELPTSLTRLYCAHNQLTTLPGLPISLTTLDYAWNNNLGSEPATRATIQAMIDRGGSVSSI